MQVSLIDIGTSKGIRIPASILKEIDTPKSFELRGKWGQATFIIYATTTTKPLNPKAPKHFSEHLQAHHYPPYR